MSLLENLLPSVLLDWTPMNHFGYSERHALLFRLSSNIQKTVYDALRERRLKMTPSRFLGGWITLWKHNQDFRIREYIEFADDFSQAFMKAFHGDHPWKLIIVDKKNLAVLVCDSFLFPVLAEAAQISTSSRFLEVPPVHGACARKSPGRFETHFFQQDPAPLKMIAVKCASSVKYVLLTVLIQCIRGLQEDFGFLLDSGSKAYVFQSLPRDPVACLRWCSRDKSKVNCTINAGTSKVATLTFVDGTSENNLLWHLTSTSHHISLSVNVVHTDTDGLILNVSSNQLRRLKLRYIEQSFNSNLTYLMMSLRISWPDNAPLDAKLNLHLGSLCESLTP